MKRILIALLVLLAFQFVPGIGVSDAQAQQCETNAVNDFSAQCTREEAYTSCMSKESIYDGVTCTKIGPGPHGSYVCGYDPAGEDNYAYCSPRYHNFSVQCDAGEEFVDAVKECRPPSFCQDLNTGIANQGEVPSKWTSYCPASACALVLEPGYTTSTAYGETVYRGTKFYTGATCTLGGDPAPDSEATDPTQDACITSGGQTMCITVKNEECYTSTRTGRRFCWDIGQTGEKTDANVLQKRNAGAMPGTPTTIPPEGTTFQQAGTPTTTTTVVDGMTITTTTTNYETDTNVDAGDSDQGEEADGTSEGDDGGVEGGVTGGIDCETPPQPSGGDPLLANIMLQTWGSRCAQEDANAVTSSGEIGDCSSAFTVEGPPGDMNVEKLKAARAKICPGELSDDPAGADGTYGMGAEDGDATSLKDGAVTEGEEQGGDGLDDSGYGYSRSCPQLPIIEVMGTTLDFNLPAMCDWMQLAGQLVLILAALTSLKILSSPS